MAKAATPFDSWLRSEIAKGVGPLRRFRSLNELAREAGVDHGQLSKFVEGKTGLSGVTIGKIAAALRIVPANQTANVNGPMQVTQATTVAPAVGNPTAPGTVVKAPSMSSASTGAVTGQDDPTREAFLATLDPDDQIVLLAKLEGLEDEEIAKRLGANRGKEEVELRYDVICKKWTRFKRATTHAN